MFGGLAFMINDKLCICSGKGRLLCRVNPSDAEQLQDETSVTAMIMNGREMRGYLIVPYENVTTKLRLQKWLKRCLAFNAQLMGTGN